MKIKKSRLKQIIKEELGGLTWGDEGLPEPTALLRDEIQNAVRDAMRKIAIRELKGKVSQDRLASTVQDIEHEFEETLMEALTPIAEDLMPKLLPIARQLVRSYLEKF